MGPSKTVQNKPIATAATPRGKPIGQGAHHVVAGDDRIVFADRGSLFCTGPSIRARKGTNHLLKRRWLNDR